MRNRRKIFFLVFFLFIVYFYYKTKSSVLITFEEVCVLDQKTFSDHFDVKINCDDCKKFKFKELSFLDSLVNSAYTLGDRHKNIQFLTLDTPDQTKVVLKYRKNADKLNALIKSAQNSNANLENVFRENLAAKDFNGQPNFCSRESPKSSLDVFLDKLQKSSDHNFFESLLIANLNFEIEFLKFFNDTSFPIPKVLSRCGIYLMETNDGPTMDRYYQSPLEIRLKIAINLMLGAIKLSMGYQGFRIYLTDATKDNISVNEKSLAISFIDLDDVIIQHENLFAKDELDILNDHQHKMITCDNCFAYSTQDICSAPRSDINIFSICQLLLEDLKGDRSNGFLYMSPGGLDNLPKPFQAGFQTIIDLLISCVYCDNNCPNRFDLANKFVTLTETLQQY